MNLSALRLAGLFLLASGFCSQVPAQDPVSIKYTYYSDKKLMKLAEKGDAEAAFQLGFVKLGGQHDQPGSIVWLHKAADLGYVNSRGEEMVGIFYLPETALRLGVPGSETEALFWLKRASEHGSSSAMNMLAGYYKTHPGTAPAGEALALSRRAAERGDTSAQIAVGATLLRGDGVPKDEAQAQRWFEMADHHAPTAETEAQIGKAYDGQDAAKAIEYLRKAAAQPLLIKEPFDYPRSDYQQVAFQTLGEIYRDGRGVPKNEALAEMCFNAKDELKQTQDSLESASNARRQAEVNAAIEANRNAGSGLVAGLLGVISAQASAPPNAIEQSKNQQLGQINATANTQAAARSRNEQAQEALRQASARQASAASRTQSVASAAPVEASRIAPVKAVEQPVASCRGMLYSVRLTSKWADKERNEVVGFFDNNSIGDATCVWAFHKNGQWTEYGSAGIPAGAQHRGGESGGVWSTGTDSSDIKYACFEGHDPVTSDGRPCIAQVKFVGQTQAGTDK